MGVILVRNQKQTVPEKYLEILAKQEKFSQIGIAMVVNDVLHVSRAPVESKKIPAVITSMCEEADFKDKTLVFYLGERASSDLKGDEEDQENQPYTILKDPDGDLSLVAFIEGDFQSFNHPESSHSDEFFVINEYLIDKFKALYGQAEEDIEKLMGGFSSPLLQREIKGLSLERGVITCLAHTGEIYTFNKNVNDFKADWGWVSQSFGYGEGSFPEKEEKLQQTSSLAEKLIASVTGKKTNPPGVHTIPDKVVEPAKTPVAAAPEIDLEEEIGPPAEFFTWGKNQKRNWYKKNFGFTPENFKQGPKIKAKDLKTDALKDFKSLRSSMAAVQEMTKKKDVEPHHIPQSTVPIISAKEKKDFNENFFTKAIQIATPDQLQMMEKKYPTFIENSEGHIKSLDDIACWDFETFRKLAVGYPMLAALLLRNLVSERSSKVTAPATDKPAEEKPTHWRTAKKNVM